MTKKEFEKLLDTYRDACYGNGWNAAMEQEQGPFHPGAYEDERTPLEAILAEFDRMTARIQKLEVDASWASSGGKCGMGDY